MNTLRNGKKSKKSCQRKKLTSTHETKFDSFASLTLLSDNNGSEKVNSQTNKTRQNCVKIKWMFQVKDICSMQCTQ